MNTKNTIALILTGFLILNMNVLFARTENDTTGFSLQEILFFESKNTVPAKESRNYKNSFTPETNFINAEINVKNLFYNTKDQEYKITFVWKYSNWIELERIDTKLEIKKEWESAYLNRGYGWDTEKGYWRQGRYTVQILINDSIYAEKDFYINYDNADFFTLEKIVKEIAPLKSSNLISEYDIIQQYRVGDYFNSFYGFTFSKDGHDIAHKMSYFKDGGTIITRNMCLFKNNKQIMPVSFMTYETFDENLNNLAVIVTKSKMDEGQKDYTLFNGTVLFNDWVSNYCSPDGSKFIYPIAAFSGYEYFYINNTKITPKEILGAKSFSMVNPFGINPVVFLKNNSGGYDTYYSGKFKRDNKSEFALFCENKLVSDIYDGKIEIPHVSSDNKNIAYIAKHKKQCFVVINGKKMTKVFNKIEDKIVFCNANPGVLYKAKTGKNWYLVKNDEIVSEGHSKIDAFAIDNTGKNVAYSVKEGKGWSVYLNKRRIVSDLDDVGQELVFDNSGSKVAFAASKNDSMFIMVNNEIISPNMKICNQYSDMVLERQKLALAGLSFNKTGDKVAYLVEQYSPNYYKTNVATTSETNDRYYYVMINNEIVSPEMWGASVLSNNNTGEYFFAGIEIGHYVLHHVKIQY